MAINFPSAPATNDTYTFNGKTWSYTGSGWKLLTSSTVSFSLAGDVTAPSASGVLTTTVSKINGVSLAGLSTGLLKNTTATGVPSIAVAGTDYQSPLVSGTSIKTVNGGSLLGSGDIPTIGGSTGQLQYNASGAPGGMSGTAWDDTNRVLTITGATVTTTNPILNLTQTWNGSSVVFTGIKFALTNSQNVGYNISSKLLDFQVGGVSKFNVSPGGVCNATTFIGSFSSTGGQLNNAGLICGNSSFDYSQVNTTTIGFGDGTGASLYTTMSNSALNLATNAAITTGTNAQGQGPLTMDVNVITTNAASPGGVTLPTGTAGRVVTIFNVTVNPVTVFPATGASIDQINANIPVSISAGSFQQFFCTSATTWRTLTAFTNPLSKGSIFFEQQVPITKSAAATLTAAELLSGIIQYTGAAASLTLPTGTTMDNGTPLTAVQFTNISYEVVFINTGSGTMTLVAGTGFTIVGAATVATATSARFRMRRTAVSSTWVAYRV